MVIIWYVYPCLVITDQCYFFLNKYRFILLHSRLRNTRNWVQNLFSIFLAITIVLEKHQVNHACMTMRILVNTYNFKIFENKGLRDKLRDISDRKAVFITELQTYHLIECIWNCVWFVLANCLFFLPNHNDLSIANKSWNHFVCRHTETWLNLIDW